MEYSQPQRRASVVLVHFGQAVRKAEDSVVDGKVKRDFHEFNVRKDLFHLPPETLVHSIVVVRVHEPAAFQTMLEKLGQAPDTCLFIDDNPRNVRTAEAVGLAGIHFINAAHLRGELAERGIIQR